MGRRIFIPPGESPYPEKFTDEYNQSGHADTLYVDEIDVRTRPVLTGLLFFLVDLVTVSVISIISVWVWRILLMHPIDLAIYRPLWPGVLMFPCAFATVGLYPGIGVGAVEEIRRSATASGVVFLMLGVATFMSQVGLKYSRGPYLLAWIAITILVPVVRALVRRVCSRQSWWGVPVVILGAGKTGQMLVERLNTVPEIGYKPVALFDDDPEKQGEIDGVPVVGTIASASRIVDRYALKHIMVAMPGVSRERLLKVFHNYSNRVPHIFVVPDLFGLSSLWVTAHDQAGTLILEARQQLLLRRSRALKRALDLLATLIGGLVLVPLVFIVGVLIRLDSKGPVFYGHSRIGKDGREFKAWKFRSMVTNADEMLEQYLTEHPELRAEWEADQKLRDDPRITRVGKFLRVTSLDELPQLWNVIRGEMSLVGPRPIVEDEIARYGDHFSVYSQVLPGVTGLWQISGRNDTGYDERVALDTYYVLNWSIWMDIYILVRTVLVVLFRQGAY